MSDRDSALIAALLRGELTTEEIRAALTETATAGGAGANYVNFNNLVSSPPPDRDWVVQEWLSAGTLALMAGPPGAGKTYIAQQAATNVEAGRRVFGKLTKRGPVLCWFCEDDAEELRRRQVRIDSANGATGDTPHDNLYIDARVGLDNVLATVGPDGKMQATGAWDTLVHEAERLRPGIIFIDNSATCYGGNENDRAHVTQFCGMLSGLASRIGCAVVLLAHVAKAQGSEFSGSTAWSGAVRTRLWLERRDDGLIELHKAKANHSALDSVLFEYADGVFREVTPGTDTKVSEAANRALRRALKKFTDMQVATSHDPRARTYLPKLMEADGLLGESTVAACAAELRSLIDLGGIQIRAELGWKDASRHPAKGLRTDMPTP